MRFVAVDVGTIGANTDRGDAHRKFGPAYEVRNVGDGALRGVVYREATIDSHGRDISVWWWAIRPGERRRIFRASGTRKAAAALL